MNDAERRRTEEQQKDIAARRAKMTEIEDAIAPLKFAPVREDASEYHLYRRAILTPEGEEVGHLAYESRSRGYLYGTYGTKTDRFRLQSKRIPTRGGYRRFQGGQRDYRKIESAIAAIRKFCLPVSWDEKRAKVLRKELEHYDAKLRQIRGRSLSVTGIGYRSPEIDRFIELLASDIPQNYLEGQEFIKILVRKKRVYNRFKKWLEEKFIEPRQKELDALDTSKERIQ